jgi:probable F420-dependent oxidoreductase
MMPSGGHGMGNIKIGIGFGSGRQGLPSPQEVCAFAERAEALGIDSIWLSDRVSSRQPQLDIACVMAMFAARTARIKMGPSVLTLPARNPVHVARTYATLDYLSGGCGRVIMAVGLGSDPKECLACGVRPEERAGRMEEGVEVLRKLWAGGAVSHHGKYYHFDDVTIEPRPARGSLDVWIGGRTDAALRRVAKYGDGWFPSFVTPQEFGAGMEKLIGFGAARSRVIDPREAGVLLLTHVTRDPAEADNLHRLLTASGQVPADSLPDRCAIGTPEACVRQIQRFVEAGCSKFVLFPIASPARLVAQIETYAADVLPAFA